MRLHVYGDRLRGTDEPTINLATNCSIARPTVGKPELEMGGDYYLECRIRLGFLITASLN